MKNFITIGTLSLLLISCVSSKSLKLETYEEGKKIRYILDLPSGYEFKENQGEVFKEYHFLYPDGSVFYFTDDYESGGAVNKDKIEKYGDDILVKIAINDTLDINGSNEEGKYWREKKETNVVIGYISATKERKVEFDNVILTMQRKPRK